MQVPELHTIFIVVHVGGLRTGLVQSGSKPVVETFPEFDAIGNRFGPLRIPTEAYAHAASEPRNCHSTAPTHQIQLAINTGTSVLSSFLPLSRALSVAARTRDYP